MQVQELLKSRKIVCVLGVMCAILGWVTLSKGNAPDFVNRLLDMELERSRMAFSCVRDIIGILGLAGSINIGLESGFIVHGSVSFAPFQLLDPLDIFMDNIANVLLWMQGSLILEKKLSAVAIFVGAGILIPLGVLFYFTKKLNETSKKFLVLGVAIALCMPLSCQVSVIIERAFLTNDAHEILKDLQKAKQNILEIGGIGGITEKTKKFLKNIPETVKELHNTINPTTKQFLHLIAIQAIVIYIVPILSFILITYMLKFIINKVDNNV